MERLTRKKLAAVVTAAALAAGGIGAAGYHSLATPAYAQTALIAAATTSTTTSSTSSSAKPGNRSDPLKTVLDQLVGQGKLSATQETDVLTAWQQYQQQHPRGGPGFGHGFGGGDIQAVATVLKLTPQQLQQQFQAGKSVAQIAQAQNVPLQTVKDAITAAAKTRLDQEVSSGRITSAQETQMLANLNSSLDQRLNATPGQLRAGHGAGPRGARTTASNQAPSGS